VIAVKFYDREEELDALEKAYSRAGADFIVVSGRRRIGKSRLIDEFARGKDSISLFVVPKEERQVAKDLEAEVRSKLGYSPSFSTFREAMEYLFERNVGLICLDEFPNALVANPAIPFELQRLWDRYRGSREVLLVVSGSYAGMMKRLFTAGRAPLFNRATCTITLQPLPLKTVVEMLRDLGIDEPSEQVCFYCVFGGVPYYYLLLERLEDRSFEKAVCALFFGVGAQLSEEGESLLRQEFGNAYARYYAILDAINAGSVSMNEISQRLGIRSTTLMKYMHALQHDFRLVERVVPFGENPVRSKRGLYSISDNTLAFWFSLVYGKRSAPTGDELRSFIGRRFEALCREFLVSILEREGERVVRAGKWWGSVEVERGKFEQREIDLVVETDRALYLGECKWVDQQVGERELRWLIASSRAFAKSKKPIKLALFSKRGFEIQGRDDLLLYDAERIVGDLRCSH